MSTVKKHSTDLSRTYPQVLETVYPRAPLTVKRVTVVMSGLINRENDETHLSTIRHETPPYSRLPGAHENPRWPCRYQRSPCSRSCAFGRLTPTVKPGPKHSHHGWFDRVFERRAAAGGRYVQLFVAPRAGASACFGISVSKRVCPLAASRNYCKRVLRAWYGQYRADFEASDIVIRVRRSYSRREFPMVYEELLKLSRRIS